MSHFAVAVFTEPNGKTVEELLAPFHEFECTGYNDEYVQDIDITEETKQEFNETTYTRYKTPDGDIVDPFSNEFYREPTEEEKKETSMMGSGCGHGISWSSQDWGDGLGYRTKVHYKPDGYEEIELEACNCESFKDFVKDWHGYQPISVGDKPDLDDKHKYGYFVVDKNNEVLKIIKRTNPNSKWDYWRVGGRYRGLVKANTGSLGDKAWEVSKQDDEDDSFDSAKIKDLIFIPDKKEYDKAIRFWELVVENQEPKTDEDREQIKWLFYKPNYYLNRYKTKENYAKVCSEFVTYAVVTPDGKWHEKGEMGWFACGSETDDESLNWDLHYKEMFFDTANPEWELTVVDCHI